MSDVVNILRALVADGTELTILNSELGVRIAAMRRTTAKSSTSAMRIVRVSEGNEALCRAMTEIYLELRNSSCARAPSNSQNGR